MFGEVGEVESVKFNERKEDSYLFHTVQCLKKKTEQENKRTRENKMHYDETLTLDHNEAFSSHNVEWRLEKLPNLLFCVKAQVCSDT